MSDDISIPRVPLQARSSFTHSYRARRSGRGDGTGRLLMVAAAIGGVLLCGMTAWSLMGRHAGPIPVIEADPRPLRVKPADPGGMQFAGSNDEMGGAASTGAGSMAPQPEAPAPQALRAQMQLPATPAPAPVPATMPMPMPPPPPAPPAATAPRPTAGTLVQLAALGSEQAAHAQWQTLVKRMPDLLSERQAVVQRADKDGHPIWRLRTGGFADMAAATGFCAKVRAKGGDCSLASF